jgi:hypothetical protein
MDPYLEAYWGDVHASLITYARDQLQPQLPRDLRAHVEEHVMVDAGPAPNGSTVSRPEGRYPDLRVVELPGGAGQPPAAAGSAAVAEPLVLPLALQTRTQRSLRIIDTRSGRRGVTAVEILSPANKVGERGRAAYRDKQEELLRGEVNLVEIDLLREGGHVVAAPWQLLPPDYAGPYRVSVVRACRPDQVEVYRVPLRQRLPRFRVPLRASDPDAVLDLQDLIERSYANGGYDGYIDYRVDPQPPLQGEDAAWADQLLRQRNRR